MDIKIIDYLPPVLQTIKEIAALMNAEQPEDDALWTAEDSILLERLLDTATEYGISRWETILGITPKVSETLDMRRTRIKSRIYFTTPYTLTWLRGWLEQQFGIEKTSVYLKDYTVYPAINPGESIDMTVLDTIEETINEVKPANLIVTMALRINHTLALGKGYSTYFSESPSCGSFFCGLHPAIASIGGAYLTTLKLTGEVNNYSRAAAFCGSLFCNSK